MSNFDVMNVFYQYIPHYFGNEWQRTRKYIHVFCLFLWNEIKNADLYFMPQTIREPVHDVKCLQVLHNNGGFGGHGTHKSTFEFGGNFD